MNKMLKAVKALPITDMERGLLRVWILGVPLWVAYVYFFWAKEHEPYFHFPSYDIRTPESLENAHRIYETQMTEHWINVIIYAVWPPIAVLIAVPLAKLLLIWIVAPIGKWVLAGFQGR